MKKHFFIENAIGTLKWYVFSLRVFIKAFNMNLRM